MFKMLFLHTIKDEICTLNADEISFFGPSVHRPILKPAEYIENAKGEREMSVEPVLGAEIEICQIHLKNKSILNVREKYQLVLDAMLMWGAMISEEGGQLGMVTNVRQAGGSLNVNPPPKKSHILSNLT